MIDLVKEKKFGVTPNFETDIYEQIIGKNLDDIFPKVFRLC